jgi:superfamily II DNA or RNA helicase
MCNSIDIASQTRKVFEKFIPGAHIGLVGDGEFDLGDVTIMTVQSAVSAYEIEYKNRRKAKRESQGNAYKKIGSDNEVTNAQRAELQRYVDTVQTVIYDECHHAQSSIASTVFRKFRHAQVMFGLSATPNYGRPEDMQIEAELGEIIYGVSYSFLIEQGWLLPPKIYIYKLPRVKYSAASYQTIYREAISQNEFRNTLIARIAEKLNLQGMTVLIVVDKKTHGNEIAKYIKRTHAIRLYGEASLEERNQVKAALNAGRVKCVISTLWDEGVDIAGLHFVINAAGGMSPVDTFQRLRSITPNPDDPKKTYGGLIDFGHKEMYLMSHSKFREKQYRSEPRFDIHEINVGKWTLEDVRKSFK